MQREIKFKAKSIEENSKGHWVEGNLILGNDREGNLYAHVEHSNFHDFAKWEVDPDTICQFTGLYDRDGNEVWEHDIVRVVKESFSFGQFEYVNEIAWAEKGGWHPMGTACDNIKEFLATISGKNVAKVIGNRFDNPELLNE